MAEVGEVAAAVGQAAVVEHLQEQVPDPRMRLLELIEQDHRERLLADALECGKLVRVLEAYTPQPRPIHLLWRQDLRPLPKLTCFVEHLLQGQGQNGQTT